MQPVRCDDQRSGAVGRRRHEGPDLIRALLVASLLLPGLGPTQSRSPVDASAWPWSAVVRVQIPGISRCTGFLLGGRTVVTAAHCLYGVRVRHLLLPSSVHVLSGYSHGTYAAHATAIAYRVAPGWQPLQGEGSAGADVAILTLEQAVGQRGLTLATASTGQPAMLGGFERDRAEVLLADRNCRVMGSLGDLSGRMLREHTCAGTYGTSGAPLLVRDTRGEWAVAGVEVQAWLGQAGGLAVPAAVVAALAASK